MRLQLLSAAALFSGLALSAQEGVGVGTTAPHASAALEVNSSAKGVLLPRLTSAAITALTSTASEGLVVFDTTTRTFKGWDGTAWVVFGSGTGTTPVNTAPVAANLSVAGNLTSGSTLTGTYTYGDADSDPENTTATGSTYRFVVADNNTGQNATIAGGTGASGTTLGQPINYTPLAAEQGKYIAFCVTPKATQGTLTGTESCSAYGGPVAAAPPVVVSSFNESFESGSPSFFSITTTNVTSNTGIMTGNVPSGWLPVNASVAASGNSGYFMAGNANGTGKVVFTSPVINTTAAAVSQSFSMKVAGFGSGSTPGLDSVTSDSVLVEISQDGGATFTSYLKLGGNSNALWTYTTSPQIYSTSFGSPLSTGIGQLTSGTGTNKYTGLSITNIPNTETQLVFRITLTDAQPSTVSEAWGIDDIVLQ